MGSSNIVFGWSWMLVGMAIGAAIGLLFHRGDWLGGYDSWRRRMVRLGHIAFLGTGILNVLYGLTLRQHAVSVEGNPPLTLGSYLLIAGAAAMPTVCFLAAAWKPLRHAFGIPVACLIVGTALLIWEGLL